MTDEYDPYKASYDDADPNTQIRTDLWNTMTPADLAIQRDLLMGRLEKVSRMFSHNTSPSVIDMHLAMQRALTDINDLINYHSSQK